MSRAVHVKLASNPEYLSGVRNQLWSSLKAMEDVTLVLLCPGHALWYLRYSVFQILQSTTASKNTVVVNTYRASLECEFSRVKELSGLFVKDIK